MSEAITADQTLRIKSIELCIELFKAIPDTPVEEFESMASDIYQFIQGETK